MKLKLLFSLVLILSVSSHVAMADNPPDICQQADNIMPNCNFSKGTDGWHTFTEEGNAVFNVLQGGGECHAPACPAGYMVTDDFFVGGIYQQVAATPGNTYQANVVWLVFDSLVNDKAIRDAVGGGMKRKMGIDPKGGTDPRSSNVIWGPENSRSDCKICDNQDVVGKAEANTITIFLRIDDRWKIRAREKGNVPPSKDQFWIDDVGLRQVSGDAVPVPLTATVANTATAEPPAKIAQSVAAVPADTPDSVKPTVIDTAITSVEPTAVPIEPLTNTVVVSPTEATPQVTEPISQPNKVDSSVPAPPPTLTPSPTRPPTMTPTPFKTAIIESVKRPTHSKPISETFAFTLTDLPVNGVGLAGTAVCIGGIFLMMLFLFSLGLIWLYQLGNAQRKSMEDEEEFDSQLTDDEDFLVEIVEEEI